MARKTDIEKLQARIKADMEKLERAKLESDPRLAPVKEAINRIRGDRNKAKIEVDKADDRIESHKAWLCEIRAGFKYYSLILNEGEKAISALEAISPDCEDVEAEVNKQLGIIANESNQAYADYLDATTYRKELTANKKREMQDN